MASEADAYIEKIDFYVQKKRYLNVLRDVIDQLSIILKLPAFVSRHHSKILREILCPTDYILIHNILSEFYSEEPSEETSAMVFLTLLDKIESNEELLTYLKNIEGLAEPSVGNLITFMTKLQKLIEMNLSMTGKQERQYQTKVRATYHANQFYKQRIATLKEHMTKMKNDLGGVLDAQMATKEQYINSMEDIKLINKEKMKNKAKEAMKNMCSKTVSSEEKQLFLVEQQDDVKEKYKRLLQSHLEVEKTARVKRSKVEVQLNSWIGKFDTDIGELETERETLQNQYDKLAEQLEDLNKKMEKQEALLTKCKEEKEEEETNIHSMIALKFLQNKCARHIQNYWRLYSRLKRGRGKKRK